MVNGYTLTLAALLLVGGSLGDHYGRRRIFLVGVAWFTVASAACGLAPNTAVLVGLRVLQGVGAALLTPGSLAIIQASFDEGRPWTCDRSLDRARWCRDGDRAVRRRLSDRGGVVAVDLLHQRADRGGRAAPLVTRMCPSASDPDARGRIDIEGAVLAVLALAGITFGLVDGPTLGWTRPEVLLPLVGGVLAAGAFVAVERVLGRRRCCHSGSSAGGSSA